MKVKRLYKNSSQNQVSIIKLFTTSETNVSEV